MLKKDKYVPRQLKTNRAIDKMLSKNRIRKEIKEKLNKQPDTQRLRRSRLIEKKLFNLTEFKRAQRIMFYVAKDREVETNFMIERAQRIGKTILVPKVLLREKKMIASLLKDCKKELTAGPYGIKQPKANCTRKISRDKIDLVLVPGLAFDRKNRRLGRGGGYYDKFLAGLSADIPRIGLAFNFQVLQTLPTLSHDISLTKIISA